MEQEVGLLAAGAVQALGAGPGWLSRLSSSSARRLPGPSRPKSRHGQRGLMPLLVWLEWLGWFEWLGSLGPAP
jgi:hypothetical protein